METHCNNCNAPMTCNPDGHCWCAELPHIEMHSDATACLCRKCLMQVLASQGGEESPT
jgi:hypothetical protein